MVLSSSPYTQTFRATERTRMALREVACTVGNEHEHWECEWIDGGRVRFTFVSGEMLVHFDAAVALRQASGYRSPRAALGPPNCPTSATTRSGLAACLG
jgi:hypothetical protein